MPVSAAFDCASQPRRDSRYTHYRRAPALHFTLNQHIGTFDGRFDRTGSDQAGRPMAHQCAAPRVYSGQPGDPSTDDHDRSFRRNGSGMKASSMRHCASVRSRQLFGDMLAIQSPAGGLCLSDASGCPDPSKRAASLIPIGGCGEIDYWSAMFTGVQGIQATLTWIAVVPFCVSAGIRKFT